MDGVLAELHAVHEQLEAELTAAGRAGDVGRVEAALAQLRELRAMVERVLAQLTETLGPEGAGERTRTSTPEGTRT